ncbi:hypothetical protein QAD02_020723 [Eretmocerus hayati]|uniref:Uncharacterized protein n=1 Tax=Eretmocerus hayati TaxID=131215 RepID=A0ACC2PT09_9HYME|nr:hypothetical protein QAD02_020723 [Eretmocerus hayati]
MEVRRRQETLQRVLERTAQDILQAAEDSWTQGLITVRMNLLDNYWNSFESTYVEMISLPEKNIGDYSLSQERTRAEGCYLRAMALLIDAQNRLDQAAPLQLRFQHARQPRLNPGYPG